MTNDLELEELISAYVDGELTGDEQSLVERALRESPRCRQVHDEFVAMRGSLQSLPREELDPDFTRRVLEKIRRVPQKPPAAANSNGQVQGSLSAALMGPTSSREREAPVRRTEERRPRWAIHTLTWAVALVATLLLAVVLAPNHLGLRFGEKEGQGTIGAAGNGGNSEQPQENGRETTPLGPMLVEDDGPKDEGLETPAPQTVSNEPPSPGEHGGAALVEDSSTPPVSLTNDPAPENDPSPQIARATPAEIPAPSPEVPLADFAVNYNSPELHVIRMAVAPEAMRSRALDEILEKEGISFRVAGARPEANGRDGEASDRPVPEIDLLLIRGAPAQLDGVFDALKKRPSDFRPTAVYTAPQDRLLDFIVAVAWSFPSAPLDPAPAPSDPATNFLENADPLSGVFELGGQVQKVFAWRAPPLPLEALDKVFPVPAQAESRPGRDEAPKNRPEQTAQIMFILFRGK
jgi:hypothetical protein